MAIGTDPALLFDLDGTLVDSVYQHVLAWREALEDTGIELAGGRIPRPLRSSGGVSHPSPHRDERRALRQRAAPRDRSPRDRGRSRAAPAAARGGPRAAGPP